VRDEEQGHKHSHDEVGGTQLARLEPNLIALIEGVEQIRAAPEDERLHGVCARLAAQLRQDVPRQDDAPRDETERYADSEQGERRHHGLLAPGPFRSSTMSARVISLTRS
jgi:hypothetical protein